MRRRGEQRDGEDEAEDRHEHEPVHLRIRCGFEGEEHSIEVPDPLAGCARDGIEDALVAIRQELPWLSAEGDPESTEYTCSHGHQAGPPGRHENRSKCQAHHRDGPRHLRRRLEPQP